MSFDLYRKLLKETQDSSIDEKLVEEDNECKHDNYITHHGSILCSDCGMEVNQTIYDKDWKYYGINDVKYSSDPNSCYIRKDSEKTIYGDLENMDISQHIQDIGNTIYMQACNGLHRGGFRKSIIFAAIFHAYKIDNKPQSCGKLIKIFDIARRDASRGMKFINENTPKNSPLRNIYITPEHMINEYLQSFSVSEDKQQEILDLYNYVKNRSSILNRSRPQSVASGVIWYWIKLHKRNISIKDFTKRVGLSELTVNKNAKEIARLCNTDDII